MSFKLENFGADASNVKSILGGANYYRYFNKDNNTLTTPGYFPADLGLAVGDRITVIPSVKTNPDELYVVTSTSNRTVTVTQIDTDGAVDSVNGKTGHVVLSASDVGAIAQLSTMPTASADEEGKIYQFIGTTDANYTNGYFYKCVSDGQDPATYSWTQVNVQPAPSGLPDQTGQNGKFLTTDGSAASWATVNALQNTATGSNALTILGTATNQSYAINIGSGSKVESANDIAIGKGAQANGGNEYSVAIGSDSTATGVKSVAIGADAKSYTNAGVSVGKSATTGLIGGSGGTYQIAIGYKAQATAQNAIQIGCVNYAGATNSDANTFKVANANGNFELMNANGNIPADRLASTSGLADGNYKPRLTISGGVPTITWVAE